MRTRFSVMFAPLAALALNGCGPTAPPVSDTGRSPDKTAVEPEKPATQVVKVVSADSLPIGDPMPVLDSGRIEVSRPKEWTAPSRDSKYVVQFVKGAERFPRIVVTADDDWSGMGDVTADNVKEFATTLGDRLTTPEHKVQLIEPVIPMMLGDRAAARYVRRTRFKATVKSVTVERQVVVTVIGGRVYDVDLQTPPGTLIDNRDAGYAVAASLQAPAE